MIVLSIHCIINRSETSLYDFSLNAILYEFFIHLRSLSAIIKPRRVFFWEGESWQDGGGGGATERGPSRLCGEILLCLGTGIEFSC